MYHGAQWLCGTARAERINKEDRASTRKGARSRDRILHEDRPRTGLAEHISFANCRRGVGRAARGSGATVRGALGGLRAG